MSLSNSADRSSLSWSTETSSSNEIEPSRWSRMLEQVGWVELGFTVVVLAVYDLIAFLLGGFGITEARCPGAQCGQAAEHAIPLPTQIQILHDSYWVIPVVFALPLLVGLFLRRWLVLIAVLQVVACGLLMLHIVGKANVLDDRLHGRVPCWNKSYSAADCPWDGRS
jgi:hypothetical protein